tara:strand:+ start:2439 stop:2651 length:213 start_codon:yes stop_codon:yes gene_type:complete
MNLSGGKPRRHRSPKKAKKVGKVGSKSNPFTSKAKAMRSTKKGPKFFKRKGRTLRFKKGPKPAKKTGKKH